MRRRSRSTTSWPATVSVNGTGSVSVTPDAATISVGVNIVETNLSEAQAKATSQMTAVLDALKAAGIDEKDIQTSNYSVYIMQNYDNNGFPAEITGYQVNNQVNATVRELDKLGDILDQVVAAGANSIYGITFMATDVEDAASQARASAVANARAKAEELAAAAGASLGASFRSPKATPRPLCRRCMPAVAQEWIRQNHRFRSSQAALWYRSMSASPGNFSSRN